MYAAGAFQVPFPFEPYPLQLDAMGAIRDGLAAGDVVVLESPTGTGKTQVLLNGVLSHVFKPHMNMKERQVTEHPQLQSTTNVIEAPIVPDPVVAGRKRRRKQRERGKREIRTGIDKQDAFLLEQDTYNETCERRRQLDLVSLSSASSSSSLLSGNEEEKESWEGEEEPLQALRKPKVYFSSRTHSQLQQLSEELRKTVFAQHPVSHVFQQNNVVIDGEKQATFPPDEVPRTLRYVHVAGRQQLCLNASLKAAAGNNNERLNELCVEAMAYEYSKEGREARREQEKRNMSSSMADIEDSPFSGGITRGCSYCRRERLKILRDYVDIAPRGLLEMRELGQRIGACPFLATRELLRSADVVLIPYSYLVSPEMRYALLSGTATNERATRAEMLEAECNGGFAFANPSTQFYNDTAAKKTSPLPPNFFGDVVVVDEAHNLVDFCRHATASTVTETDFTLVRGLLDGYYTRYEGKLLTRNKQRIREMVSFLDKIIKYLKSEDERIALGTRVSHFSSFVFDANVDNVNVYRFLAFLNESRLLPKLHGLVASLLQHKQERQQRQIHMLPHNRKQNEKTGFCSDSGTANDETEGSLLSLIIQNNRTVTGALHRFDTFLRWYSRSDEYTRVLLRRLRIQSGKEEEEETRIITLQLLQLEPGTNTMFPVLQQAQAVVLAGGTMKPLALTCDLLLKRPGVAPKPFCLVEGVEGITKEGSDEILADKKVRFIEEGHIVPSSSVAVFALGVGPSGYRVELQHSTRSQWQRHFDEIAAVLLNFCRVVPSGMIVFFTSYEVEELFVAQLHRSGMYNMINEVKRIFRESGRVASFTTTTISSTTVIGGEEEAGSSNSVDGLLEQYARWIRANGSGGALLFAVMGGKLSEGINFNDDLGRAVVVVGLPYANPSDVELQLYLNHVADTRLLAESNYGGTKPLATEVGKNEGSLPFSSATQWGLFTDLCMRSVNQSIGRCIRHAADYAVIILLDVRYAERADIKRRIASWMQPSIRVTRNFGECFKGVRDFFATLRRQQKSVGPLAET